ncbi:MAG: TonB-dependent receptor [Pseudomonadota bacterium]
MQSKPKGRLLIVSLVAAALPAWSQDAPPPSAESARVVSQAEAELAALDGIPVTPLPATVAAAPIEKVQLQEVVVSAARRKKSINKTAIAVTEVSGAALTAGVIRDTQSAQLVVPSLVVTVSGSESSGGVIRIRGIGTAGAGNAGLEGSVGVFVDGVYLPRAGLAFSDLVDIDRIEVLRGPQGTLFGKNTSAGAINILTRKPSFEPQAELTFTGGDYRSGIVRAIVSGPVLGDVLALRFAGQYNLRDGFIHNTFDGEDYNDRNRYSLRGQALYQPGDDLSLRLIGGYYKRDEMCCVAPYTFYGPTAAQLRRQGGTVFDPPSFDTVSFDASRQSKITEANLSTHLDWDLGWADAKALLSYQRATTGEFGEVDSTDLDLLSSPFSNSRIGTATAETSLSGKAGRLDWVGGLFLSYEELDVANALLLGEDAGEFALANISNAPPAPLSSPVPEAPFPGEPIFFPPSPVPPSTVLPVGVAGPLLFPPRTGQTLNQSGQIGKNASLFTHNVIDLGRDIDLTLGLRYLFETKDGGGISESNSPSCTIPMGTPGVPPALRILCGAPRYRVTFSDRRFTGTTGLSKSFGPAFVYASYSSGFKSGGINLSPSTTNGGTLSFEPEKVQAYELGLKMPFFGKAVQTRTALFHSTFSDYQLNFFDGVSTVISNIGEVVSRGVEFETTVIASKSLRFNGGLTYADAFFAQSTQDANLRGRQVTNSPRWTSTLSASYKRALPWQGMSFSGNVAGRYQSAVNTSASLLPQARQAGYSVINARLGLGFRDDFDVALVGTNITDKVYQAIIFASIAQAGSFNGFPGPPRTIGLELRKRF